MSSPRHPESLAAEPVPMYGYYVIATEDERFEVNLVLGHVTASSPEQATKEYDTMFEDETPFRAVIREDQVTWYRMTADE